MTGNYRKKKVLPIPSRVPSCVLSCVPPRVPSCVPSHIPHPASHPGFWQKNSDWPISRPILVLLSFCPGTIKKLLSFCPKKLHCPLLMETLFHEIQLQRRRSKKKYASTLHRGLTICKTGRTAVLHVQKFLYPIIKATYLALLYFSRIW